MIFIDGTWLYYNLVVGSGTDPVSMKFGKKWQTKYRIDFPKIPQIIAKSITQQLQTRYNYTRLVDTVKTSVFTSAREDTEMDSQRSKMLTDFTSSNFELHRLVTTGPHEKCVDVSLAVEMLYMATVPDAYDIGVIVTGDKDFMPAMEKTRMKGKRVAVCSMRHSCNRELSRPDQHIRDFDVIWLENYLDELVVPKFAGLDDFDRGSLDNSILKLIRDFIAGSKDEIVSSRDIGRKLQVSLITVQLGNEENGDTKTRDPPSSPFQNALTFVKQSHGNVKSFICSYPQYFVIQEDPKTFDFYVRLKLETDETDERNVKKENSDAIGTDAGTVFAYSSPDVFALM